MITRVLPDANALYSRTLRDWLFLIRNTAGGMYTVHTTEDILAEVVHSFRRRNAQADGGKVSRLVASIRDHVDDVLREYPADPNYSGVDPHDQHVHAAACTDAVDVLITGDLGLLALQDERYETSTPDEFFCFADDSQPAIVRAVALKQVKYWASKGGSLNERLVAAGCPNFAARVDAHLEEVLRLPAGQDARHVLDTRTQP